MALEHDIFLFLNNHRDSSSPPTYALFQCDSDDIQLMPWPANPSIAVVQIKSGTFTENVAYPYPNGVNVSWDPAHPSVSVVGIGNYGLNYKEMLLRYRPIHGGSKYSIYAAVLHENAIGAVDLKAGKDSIPDAYMRAVEKYWPDYKARLKAAWDYFHPVVAPVVEESFENIMVSLFEGK